MDTTSSTRIAVFKIRIMGPVWSNYIEEGKNSSDAFKAFDEANQQVVDSLGGTLSEVEETISSMLPDGFYAKIEN